jgi:probable F420-dependent oxidoreductase
MRIGVTYPQIELASDAAMARDFAQAVEGMGFQHLSLHEHVLGVDPTNRPGWHGPHDIESRCHEPFVVCGFLAGVTTTLEFETRLVVLPQRQTAVVAKQAAEVDLLSGARFRLGIGLGWNELEFQSLGQDFHTRGRRMEEQIALLRALWTERVVTFDGRWHRVEEMGMAPVPGHRIPIWIGGGASGRGETGGRPGERHVVETALRRIARLADGWLVNYGTCDQLAPAIERLREYAREAGRDPATLGIAPTLQAGRGTPDEWSRELAAWRAAGATHLSVSTLGSGYTTPEQHLAALRRFKEEVL